MAKNKRIKDNTGQPFTQYLDDKCCQVAILCITIEQGRLFEFTGKIQGMGIDLRRWRKRIKGAKANRRYYGQEAMKKLLYRLRLALGYKSVGVDIKYPRANKLLPNDICIMRDNLADWRKLIDAQG
jgi:hypothetical protein